MCKRLCCAVNDYRHRGIHLRRLACFLPIRVFFCGANAFRYLLFRGRLKTSCVLSRGVDAVTRHELTRKHIISVPSWSLYTRICVPVLMCLLSLCLRAVYQLYTYRQVIQQYTRSRDRPDRCRSCVCTNRSDAVCSRCSSSMTATRSTC